MTLTRLVLAWIPTAAWFALATYGTALLVTSLAKPVGQPAVRRAIDLPLLKWRAGEAALLTLLASLWFDTLGRDGWWLVFLLVGALATLPAWRRTGAEPQPARALVAGASADLARYVVAGAILAWRLG